MIVSYPKKRKAMIVSVWLARFLAFCLAAFWTAGTHAHA